MAAGQGRQCPLKKENPPVRAGGLRELAVWASAAEQRQFSLHWHLAASAPPIILMELRMLILTREQDAALALIDSDRRTAPGASLIARTPSRHAVAGLTDLAPCRTHRPATRCIWLPLSRGAASPRRRFRSHGAGQLCTTSLSTLGTWSGTMARRLTENAPQGCAEPPHGAGSPPRRQMRLQAAEVVAGGAA